MKVSSTRRGTINLPIGIDAQSVLPSVGLNGGIFFIPENTNSKIKKIALNIYNGTIPLKNVIIRLRGRNRDVSTNTCLGGNILNPISGPFNGSLTKNTDYDLILTLQKNLIEFHDPILLGGFQIVSYAWQRYDSSSAEILRFSITLFYE